jgi:hypothetical protein
MQSSLRRVPRSAFVVCCCMLTLLVSCGGSPSSQGSTPTPTPKPSPTQMPSPSPTLSSSSGFQTFVGQGFTVDYPAGWHATKSGNNVTLADSTGLYNFIVQQTDNPNGVLSADTFVTAAASAAKAGLKNSQDESAPSPVTVGGDSWVQKSFSGSSTQGGQSVVVQFYLLADNHPAQSPSTKSFDIIYGTAKQLMSSAQASYFQPMLQSFKFTS